MRHSQNVLVEPPFDRIREMCVKDLTDSDIDTSPTAFRDHRVRTWPQMVSQMGSEKSASLVRIYDAVKQTGVPNCMGARIQLESDLNIQAWERYADMESDEAQLLEMIKFGFPLGYMGPPSNTLHVVNHSSAIEFADQVQSFIDKEVAEGALVGPFLAVPFSPWAHVSPLMSRPKSDGVKHRIISDLTFPPESSVNAYIQKNSTSALGEVGEHTLPTVADFVEDLRDVGVGAYMFTLDVARAYKNFRVDPLDWPLM